MPDPEPSLPKIIIEGGIFMGPFLILSIVWVGATISFYLRKNRSLKHLIALALFPMGFGLLAAAHWSAHWPKIQMEMFVTAGYPFDDPVRLGRSTLVVVSVGGLSLLSAAVALAFPLKNHKQGAEQDGTGQPATRPESKSEGNDKPQPEAEGRSR